VRDEVAGWFTQTDELRSFIRESAQTDQPIRFYPTYREFRKTVGTLQRPQALPQASEITDVCANTPDGTALSFSSNGMLEKPPPEFTFSMPGALRLESIALAYDKASITGQSPVRIQTAPQQWAYAASIPIVLDRTPHAKRLVHIRGRVRQGQIGIGILNRKTNTFQVEKVLNPTPTAVDYYIPTPMPEAADDLIFRNTSFHGAPSEIIVDATEILAPAHRIEPWSHLTDIELAYDKASIERGMLRKLWAQVTSGEIGGGILASDQKQFITEQRYGQTAEPTDIAPPVPWLRNSP